LPDQGIIDRRVSVNQNVAERDDPAKLWNLRGQVRVNLGKLIQRLTDDLELGVQQQTAASRRLGNQRRSSRCGTREA
jgi:hypothetical protein